MKIAIVGTGFVADYYMTTLPNHPQLVLGGVYDRDPVRLRQFADFYKVATYPDFEAVLADGEVGIVVNLTTPENHYSLSKQALEAGKHVYCEKPLAMRYEEAAELVAIAERQDLVLASAPANALSAAHTLVDTTLGSIGKPRLVYAEMEDGPVFHANWQEWRSVSGARWPGLHEFEVGCTLGHAGYALSWLVSLFGAVESLSAFSALTFPNKGPGTETTAMAPDFSVGCLMFRSGVIARLTCGLAAPRDRSLTILGDKGSLIVGDLWDHQSPVYLETAAEGRTLRTKLAEQLEACVCSASCPGSHCPVANSPMSVRRARSNSRPIHRRSISPGASLRKPALSKRALRCSHQARWRCTSPNLALHSTMLVRSPNPTGCRVHSKA